MRSTKGKTWEEIYGVEYTAEKRAKSSQVMRNRLAGKTYEEIMGEELAQELRVKRSKQFKGIPKSESHKEALRNPRKKGYRHEFTEEHKANISKGTRGKPKPWQKGNHYNREWIKENNPMNNPESVAKAARNNRISGRRSPNGKEIVLMQILDKYFYDEFRYVGEGAVSIGTRIPDFISTKGSKIIEHFGDYHHRYPNEANVEDRISYFARYGFCTLVIREHELEDVTNLRRRIEIFLGKENE